MLSYKGDFGNLTQEFLEIQKQTRYATSVALNRTAVLIRDALKAEMPRAFDRPTAYTQNALTVVWASKANLVAQVQFRDAAGKGLAADKYLGPEVFGGGRNLKRSELALQRIGLSTGKFAVPAAAAEIDSYGNMSRGQTVRLLSYLQAFGEQGYRANATPLSKKRTEKNRKGKKADGGFKTINGVRYFVSRGPGTWFGKHEHLAAGIWAARGTHGVDIKPVMVFTKAPSYTPRLDFYGIADAIYGESFDEQFSSALDMALATAR
jgi:hypothetical protein